MPSDLGPAGPRDPLRAIYDREQRRPPRARLLAAAAAVLVLGAFAVIVYYAYNAGIRAGSESVAPLIKAEQQPYKVKPEEPGGIEVPNQDKLIYNEVSPKGTSESGKTVERLMPPPEAPLPKPEPAPQPQPQAQAPAPSAPPLPPPQAASNEQQRPPGVPPYVPLPPPPAQIAPVPGSGSPPQKSPASGLQAPPAPPMTGPVAQPAPPPAASPPPASASAVSVPVAAAAPAKPAPASPAVNAPKAGGQATAPVAKGSASGAWHIQLGAVRAPEDAQREWARLKGKHPDLLGELTLTVQRVDLGDGKGVFFRIQGGPLPDRESANGLCDRLKAVQVGCLAVRS